MQHTNSRQDRSYRRGLILGFTMAEIMILILFAILMALGATIFSKEERIKALVQVSGAHSVDTARLIQEIRRAFPNAQTIDEQFKEIRMAIQNSKELDVVKRELEKLRAELESYKELKKLLENAKNSPQTSAAELAQDAILGKEMKEFAKNQTPPIAPGDVKSALKALNESTDLISQKRTLEKENETLKGQILNLTQRLGGRGTEYPPCWVASNGKPDYIFDVALKSNGYIIRDRKLPHRQEEQSLLPIQQITFDSEISPRAFSIQTEDLLNWSKDHNCRFFVRIYDQTGQQEKDNYKLKERILQQSFYSYEVLNERF
ncbi:hypothetical protein [Methylomicrobium lacus]|uniref:PulJ/GspJ family protein n=1 Tax=Methylomicrobium lacus TaxID=136992 RepID=UPI0035A8BA2D